MKISKTHQLFSEYLKQPRALTNPEEFLGPNWEDVINFWLYVDGLSASEKNNILWELEKLYGLKSKSLFNYSWQYVYDISAEVVGPYVRSAAWLATLSANDYGCFSWATYELLAHHKLLEQDKTLVFLPLCINQ